MYGFISLGFNLKHTNIPFVNMFPRTYIRAFFFLLYMKIMLFIYENGILEIIIKLRNVSFKFSALTILAIIMCNRINTLYFYFQDTNSFFLTKNLRAQGIKVRVAQWGGEGEQEKIPVRKVKGKNSCVQAHWVVVMVTLIAHSVSNT